MQIHSPILQIVVASPLRRIFDYLPSDAVDPVFWKKGQRVLVPFGRRSVVGIIVDVVNQSAFPREKLKKIIEPIDVTPVLEADLLKLMCWASDYYHHPLGEVIFSALPKKIRAGHKIALSEKPTIHAIEQNLPDFKLTEEQTIAINTIIHAKKFQTFLLAGVTGSGKTEVYMRVIAAILQEKKQALILVPEIALTPQTVSRFQERFCVPVLLYHSGLSDKKRLQAWEQARGDSPCIVIGTRSAVFSPLQQCGVIIVDESHDTSFKQQSGFRYSARDVAIMRGNWLNVPVILGTATPSLESWHNVQKKKYHLLSLRDRAAATLPKVIVHDIRGQALHSGLSDTLIQLIQKHLDQSNQVLLFLNRRGYAPVLICHHCGWTVNCAHCDAKLTLHRDPKRLCCHHCGYQTSVIQTCEACQQSELTALGLGTERLEKTLSQLFPSKKIARIDRDSMKTFSTLEKTLKQVHDREVDIIIGTQMLVKGHHFDHVTLVAAIDVDGGLFSADFRATERLGQSLIQVAGRAGRSEKIGEVFVQTREPNHILLKTLFSQDYFAFADVLLKERSVTKLPPYRFMAILRAESKNKERANQFLLSAKQSLKSIHPIELAGPMPSIIEKKAGIFRSNLLIQSAHRSHLQQALHVFLQSQEKIKKLSGLRWILDVDPVEIT